MVADTKERMTEMFDVWNDGFRTAMDAGRKTQESFFRVMGDFWKTQPEFEGVYARGERAARELVPFVNRNVQTVSECAETTLRTGMDVFKVACDTATKADDVDVYRRTRNVWDATFGAARTNFDAVNKAGTRIAENFSEFVRNTCSTECAPKAAAKTATK